jgi:hypothetical protein
MLLCGLLQQRGNGKKKKARHFPFSNENIYEKWGGLNKGETGRGFKGLLFPPPWPTSKVAALPTRKRKAKGKKKKKWLNKKSFFFLLFGSKRIWKKPEREVIVGMYECFKNIKIKKRSTKAGWSWFFCER